MRAPRVLPLLVLLSVATLSGCFGRGGDNDPAPEATDPLVAVDERHLLPYNVTGFFSRTLAAGPYGILDGRSFDVPVNLPVTAGADGALGMASVNLGLFMPDIAGCDWEKADLPAHCKVPVIADVGPYYSASTSPENPVPQMEGDNRSTEPAQRLGKFLVDNFVPHGYAVAQVSVLGTGDSTSCQDLMGLNEQAGVNAAVEWLGTQGWSNGAVALIGRSYDGSTPWEAATFGNPHLKTIVPISGLTGVYELMWRNGSAESRGPGLLYAIYATFTVDGDADDPREVLCPEYLTGAPQGLGAYASGGPNDVGHNNYWSDRYFLDRVYENYRGSVYFIHGLQDWNVENHMVFPHYNDFIARGYEVKGLFGQWQHMYPDRPTEHVSMDHDEGGAAYPQSVRYDWAQDLLEWFDHYLKGTGPKPSLHAEVQDNRGGWRIEGQYPPADARQSTYNLGVSMPQVSEGPAVIAPGPSASLPVGGGPDLPETAVVFEAPALAQDTRIVGQPRMTLWVTPTGSGGQVYAELQDVAPNGTALRVGHAIMDLRFAAGGKTPSPVTPGDRIAARMEFEAFDAVVPAGHHLRLLLTSTGRDYLPAATQSPVVVDTTGASVLNLLTVERGPDDLFVPPAWSGEAEATAPQP